MPVTIASWCSVPRAPLRLVGAISPTYIGTNPDANPYIENEKQESSNLNSDFVINSCVDN